MDDILDFDEAAIYVSQKTGNKFTSEKIYRLASEWEIQPSIKLIGLHHAGFYDHRGRAFSTALTEIEGAYRLKKSQTNAELLSVFFRKKMDELIHFPPIIVHSNHDLDLFFKITKWKVGLDMAVRRMVFNTSTLDKILTDASYIGFSECDLDSYMGTTAATPAEPITTLQAIGIMAELLALEDGCYKYRKGESNVNAKAISVAVSNRAKARFGDDVRGFDSFNKKISEGLKALEKL